MRRTILLLGTVWVLIPFGTLRAQEAPRFEPGARLRVSTQDAAVRHFVGTFEGYDGGNIGIRPDHELTLIWVPLASVTNVQSSRGRKSQAWRGALIGLLAGGTFGAFVGAATYEECVQRPGWEGLFDCYMYPESASQAAAMGGLTLGLLGAGIGALIGASTKTDRWQDISLDRVRMSVVPRRGRFTLGLSMAF
jgi:hypothetical protein